MVDEQKDVVVVFWGRCFLPMKGKGPRRWHGILFHTWPSSSGEWVSLLQPQIGEIIKPNICIMTIYVCLSDKISSLVWVMSLVAKAAGRYEALTSSSKLQFFILLFMVRLHLYTSRSYLFIHWTVPLWETRIWPLTTSYRIFLLDQLTRTLYSTKIFCQVWDWPSVWCCKAQTKILNKACT